jgi:hypothetical protein
MDYGYVLKRAWEIIWKFKVLWIFGILASCGQAASSGSSNSSYRFSSQDSNLFPQIDRFFAQPDPAIIALMIGLGLFFILALIVIFVLLGTIGRVGLIRGAMKAEQGAQRLTFGELWRDGLKYFWRVFGLNLLVGVVIFLVVLALFVPGVILTGITFGLILLCCIPLMCLFIPVMWAVAIVIEQANIALVVENLGILDAIKHGWQVVRKNIGNMVVMSLILFLGVGLIGSLVIGLPFIIVSAPAFIGAFSGTTEALRNGLLISGLLFLVYLPVLLLLSGVLRSYTSSAWTLTYLQLTAQPSQSIIEAPSIPEDMDIPPVQTV